MNDVEINERTAELLGELMRLTALANLTHRGEYIYALRYDCGKWLHLTKRGYGFDGYKDIVPRDTQATEENLRAAVVMMRLEIKNTKENIA